MSFFDFGPAVGNDGKRGNGNGTAWRRSATDSVVGEQEKKTQVYDVRSLRRKKQCTPYATLLPEARFYFSSPSPPRPPSSSLTKRSSAEQSSATGDTVTASRRRLNAIRSRHRGRELWIHRGIGPRF